MFVQFLARFFLLLFVAHGWFRFASAVDRQGNGIGCWLLVITACQFHMPFYASRMLPNVFALVVVLHSYAFWFQGKIRFAAAGIVFGTAVFRCDLLLLLVSLGLSWLILRQLSILEALKIGVATGIVSLLLTVPFDSLLWQRLLWPEGEVFYFNTVLGKSSDWGTSPWHWYLTSALPKSMLLTLLLVPLSSLRIAEVLVAWERQWRRLNQSDALALFTVSLLDVQWLRYMIPIIGFVAIYSFLGHKEMRFIFPAVPILNLAAAVGMSRLTRLSFPPSKEKNTSWIARTGFFCGLASILLTLSGSLAFSAVSKWNYPGGDALLKLTDHVREKSLTTNLPSLHVYVDVATAMSGVSLFGQRAAQTSTPELDWGFVKAGYENEHVVDAVGYNEFSHLLSESSELSPDFHVIAVIQGMPRLDLRHATIIKEDSIYILERNGWVDGE